MEPRGIVSARGRLPGRLLMRRRGFLLPGAKG
jgi:hypothetical protein